VSNGFFHLNSLLGAARSPAVVADNNGPAARRQPVCELDLGPMVEPSGIQQAENYGGDPGIELGHGLNSADCITSRFG